MERLDCAVIGAGVIGLAAARALARAGREVVILEAEPAIGTHTSSRNSEVIHAGMYYKTGSLKARLCVQGKQALYRYCEVHGVPYRRCGKLIVATRASQHGALEALKRQAEANGVHDLQWLSAGQAKDMEPEVRCTQALWSPSTGILDSHAYLLALQGDAEACGATLALRSPVLSGRVGEDGIELEIGGDAPVRVQVKTLVNSAGLWAQQTARRIRGMPQDRVPPCHFAKGHYFTLAGRTPFRHLVYPIPEAAGLGVHVTLDMAGRARFGPDVQWVDSIDYAVDERRADRFYDAIRDYWPGLPPATLLPGYAGIRPKIQGPGEPAQDFMLQGPLHHGVPGLVNLFGMESPGLTASLAIAKEVMALLAEPQPV
jgi:L-2-hydroxyglutarate oxidase LhgO